MWSLLFACQSEETGQVRVAEGETPTDGTPEDTSPGTKPTGVETVAVAHPREMRAFWVATAWNINFPSQAGLSASAGQAELVALVDAVEAARANALVFQVRPEGDALYASDLEPWSRFLSGTQGRDPGYDPLAVLIEAAHSRGIEVHAWLNPYRAKTDGDSTAVAPHVAVEFPEHMVRYDGLLWMDPGADPIRERTVAVVADLCERYDIDGISFDDYFYPYPDGSEFGDDATWAAYQGAGGTLGRDDWRRHNVNRLVEEVSAIVAAHREDVRFGIAPFGIYRPGIPEGISGLDQYAEIFADPLAWIEAGWLDYVAPQLYWTHDDAGQEFGTLIDWWVSQPTQGQYTFPGIYLSKLGESGWDLDEYATQIALTRAEGDRGALGQMYYNIEPAQGNVGGVTDRFAADWYAEPAASPVLVATAGEQLAIPTVNTTADGVEVSHADPIRYWAVYREEGTLERLVPGGEETIGLGSGVWAVSAIDRRGVESRGVVVRIP